MIGNDIVDLEFAKCNSRWKEHRFLDKLFSKEEQDFILSDENRFQNIWRLWSMKESAYKIISRAGGIVRFNPKDFCCFTTNPTKGYVVFENKSIPTVTQTTPKFIQTTACLEPSYISEVFQFLHKDSKLQHKQSYEQAIKAYAQWKKQSQETVEIIKNEIGVPQFCINGRLLETRLSLTHHGHFGAFAIAV
ncbi:MAG: 4'-phosphopantetheinyl transferase superfamily protein [Gelidibacter sp.]